MKHENPLQLRRRRAAMLAPASGRKAVRMLTATAKSRPGSPLRLLTLLAIAHASLAFYLWFCAPGLSLVSTPVRLWEIVSGLWLVWPALPGVRAAARSYQPARISATTPSISRRAIEIRFGNFGSASMSNHCASSISSGAGVISPPA